MYKKLTLKNGLRVLLVPQKDSLSTTVLVLVEAGSKYETKEINGLSHFLEHMCFKGTKKRPTALDIASELESIGASYNAFTGQEYTGYYAKVRNSHLDIALDVVSDIYLNQLFDEKEIEKERGVVSEEINMKDDEPMEKVGNLIMELMYGDQPTGWPIAGRKEVIKKLSRNDFVKYHAKNYVASSTIVVVAGKFDEKNLVNEIKNKFAAISTGKKHSKLKTKENQKNPAIKLEYKKTDQTHIILAMRAFSMFDKRRYALEVLTDILGGGMSSRLFQKVRGELGAAYYVYASADMSTDYGSLSVSAGIDHNKIDIVLKSILGELKKLSEKEVSEKELNRAKEHMTGGLAIGLETSSSLASYYGGQEVLREKIETPEEVIKKIQAVKASEIMAVANDIIKNKNLNLAIIGPFNDKKRFEKILKF